ncbi:hypothetical protein GCM10010531_20420 [Blastococcus jejuensis]|uniref:Alpha/beta hydrolase family protein n=1 Tax=Blastococcus jejuensis TaxID=351224 RepID=A0ABP6P6A3_9ACTN
MTLPALSVRSELGDTPMADVVRVARGLDDALHAPRLIILIHGYQNSETAAHESFSTFAERLATVGWPTALARFGTLWEFHWPGNHPNRIVSLATYSVRVPEAIRAGEKLAEFLGDLSAEQEVCLVAHSLGCRVALETVHKIGLMGAGYRGPQVSQVFLMAAAVPVPLCESGQRLDRAAPGDVHHVYHSNRDSALTRAKFGIGQSGYGGELERGPAVGLEGAPEPRWASSVPTGIDHGGYWSSYLVAEDIARRLGVVTERSLPEHTVPVWDLEDLWVSLDAEEGMAEREITSRDATESVA